MAKKDQTGVQTIVSSYDGRATPDMSDATFQDLRQVRKDPVIFLARVISVAPILLSEWSYEVDDEELYGDAKDFIKWQMERIRSTLLKTAVYSQVDFGWKSYELIFSTEDTIEHGVRTIIKRLKPLLNDITYQLRDNKTGEYMGLYQQPYQESQEVYIDAQHSLFVNFDSEGVGNYGEALLSKAKAVCDAWDTINTSASRYDKKIAGSNWIIYYPPGTQSTYNGRENVDNYEVAKDILAKLHSNGSVVLPSEVTETLEELDGDADTKSEWRVELVSAPGASQDFVTRMKYLDTLKIRALGITERSITEGQYGTKAEAGEHFNVLLMIRHLDHQHIVELINWHLVNRLTRINYGREDIVRIVANPLTDERKALLSTIFKALINNPSTSIEVLDKISDEEVLEELGVPQVKEDLSEDIAETEPSIIEKGENFEYTNSTA